MKQNGDDGAIYYSVEYNAEYYLNPPEEERTNDVQWWMDAVE